MSSTQPLLVNLHLPNGVEKIDHIVEGYESYQTLIAAIDLGLFDFLDKEGPSDREKITQGININGMFSRCFLNTLVDIGLLIVQDEKYANTDTATSFLTGNSPFYQGDWIQNAARGNHWNNLAISLKRQQPEMDNFSAGPSGPFINSLAQRTLRGELQKVTRIISNWEGFSRAKSLLDLGGGHGLYAITLCQMNPQLGGVVFDKPHVIDTTRSYIQHYGMEERLSTQGGDICTDSFGHGYDIVIVSHLLYKFRKNLEPIFDKVYECLNSGGLLVSNHWFCASGCTPESSGVKELAKSLQSFGHPLCHVEDFDKLFMKKGFKIIATSEVPSAYDNSRLHLAVKESDRKENTKKSDCC